MATYKNVLAIPNVDLLTIWVKNGDFYHPDPTKVHFWNGTSYAKNPDAVVADLPDHFFWQEDYVENQPITVFETVI